MLILIFARLTKFVNSSKNGDQISLVTVLYLVFLQIVVNIEVVVPLSGDQMQPDIEIVRFRIQMKLCFLGSACCE